MIAIDDLLHDFLDARIDELKKNPNLVDYIFEGKSKARKDMIKQWISGAQTQSKDNTIRTVIHHPRDASDLPCYVIVLNQQAESDQVIGSTGAQIDNVVISNMEDGWISSDSDIKCTRSQSPSQSPNIFEPQTLVQFYSSLITTDGRKACHVIGDKGTCEGKGIWIDFEHSVLEKPDISGFENVSFWIRSNRVGQFLQFGFGKNSHQEHIFDFNVTVIGMWEKIRIDISGVPRNQRKDLRYMSFTITDDSQPIDIYIDELSAEKNLGSMYAEAYFDNSYRIESWSNNAEMTLAMHQIALWNLLRFRTYLEGTWGLLVQRAEGGDILPQPEWYPEFVYVRSLTYSCKTIELVPIEMGLTAIEDVVAGGPPGGSKIDYGVGGGSISDP